MGKLQVVDHPIVAHNLTAMRNAQATSTEFRARLRRISAALAYEATRNLPLVEAPVETPVTTADLPVLGERAITVVPILRAGVGMLDGVLDMIPHASVGFIGMERDEATHVPREYYCKLPVDAAGGRVYVIDPMLATGGSAIDAIGRLKDAGCSDITMLCIVAAPEGVAALQEAHADVDIFAAALDDGLTDAAYITPGLGDAGDRIFGTD